MKFFLTCSIALFMSVTCATAKATEQEFSLSWVISHGNDTLIPFRFAEHDEYNTANSYASIFATTEVGVVEISTAFQLYTPAAPFQKNGKGHDRLYAGVFNYQIALHTKWSNGIQTRFALGADVIGPQTNLDTFQTRLHKRFDVRVPHKKVLEKQIANTTYFATQLEVAYPVEFSWITFRPFTEIRFGYENLARVGVDVFFGGAPSVLSREYVTGQVYTPQAPQGWSVNLGMDYTHVFSSALYPEHSPVEMLNGFMRIRSAIVYQGDGWNAQFGIASIAEQFAGQKHGWQEVAYITAGTSW